ncbi:FAD-dependent urate hydroxylase-like [Gossypium australe]|uniref:FAD-dependent urate hydroxylase-like n=1 Tax=Gossypium australe TaxID=47621 RepID=A0A5B6WYE9_9ROSI|nr:FAD-dependent urate hydroxylase-like [Gossypium australe]
MNISEQEQDIVIVGGGISGLATALALRRKGIKSMVLERSETLRAAGVGIIMQPNGWRALDQLGVAPKLRQTCTEIPSRWGKIYVFISVAEGKCRESELPLGKGELRCLKRMELMKALAEELPVESVYLGCRAVSILLDPLTSNPLLQLHDGTLIKAKVLYHNFNPSGHSFGDKFRFYSSNDVTLGQLPVTDNLVYWFLTRVLTSQDLSDAKKDPAYITKASLEAIKGFPEEIVELVKNTEPNALYLTELRYRAPWDLVRTKFRKGTVVVAGDAMHAMCPFISQGGGASLEDAVVLARCLSEKLKQVAEGGGKRLVEETLDEYVRERRMRVFWLSLQTYFIGLAQDNTSKVKKALGIAGLILVFGDQRSHTDYDCGRL